MMQKSDETYTQLSVSGGFVLTFYWVGGMAYLTRVSKVFGSG